MKTMISKKSRQSWT